MKLSKRHKKLPLKTKVFRRIEEIDPHDWNRVYPKTLEGYHFFKALDECNLDKQFSFYYILVYKGDAVAGAAPLFMVNYSLDTSIKGPLRHTTNFIKRFAPGVFSLKALACGMPMGRGRIGASEDAGAVTAAILRRMERMARKEKAAAIAFKDFERRYTYLLDPLLKDGFTRFDSLPSTEMEINFKNFEGYLNTLSAASRYDLRRKFKNAVKHGKIEMEICDSLDEAMLPKVYDLYLQVEGAHEMGFEIVPMEFFKLVPKHMPGHTKYFLWRVNGKLAAFVLCLVSQDILIDYYLGLDYTVAHNTHLYFVKFRDVLAWCIEHNIKSYEMGTTGYEPKRRLGFNFIPLYLYVKLLNPFIRPFFNFFCRLLKFENFDPALKSVMEKIQP